MEKEERKGLIILLKMNLLSNTLLGIIGIFLIICTVNFLEGMLIGTPIFFAGCFLLAYGFFMILEDYKGYKTLEKS